MLRLQNTRRGLETLVRVGKMVDARMVDGLDIIDVVNLLLEHREQDGYMHALYALFYSAGDRICASRSVHTITRVKDHLVRIREQMDPSKYEQCSFSLVRPCIQHT